MRWPPSMSILPADRCSRSGWETLALTTFPAGQHACQAEGTSARRDCPGHQITCLRCNDGGHPGGCLCVCVLCRFGGALL